MKLTRSTIILVNGSPSGTLIGDQATLRGKKVSAIIALTGKAPSGPDLLAPASAYISLQDAEGKLIHEDLPMNILLPSTNGGIIQELGDQVIDWTKSSVKGAGLVGFSVVYQ
jgi:hypothetical protein